MTDTLRRELMAAQDQLEQARDAADALRQAEAERQARGLMARLRAAWRGSDLLWHCPSRAVFYRWWPRFRLPTPTAPSSRMAAFSRRQRVANNDMSAITGLDPQSIHAPAVTAATDISEPAPSSRTNSAFSLIFVG